MKKHTFDPFSFIAGAILLTIAGGSVLNADFDLRLSDWVLPASVLMLGVGLLVASLRGMGRDDGPQTTDDRAEAEARAEAEDHGQQITDHEPESDGDTLVD